MSESWDRVVLTGLARLARPDDAPVYRKVPCPRGGMAITSRGAGFAKAILKEFVVSSFVAAGGGLAIPFPNPARESETCREPVWNRWKPQHLAFLFGPISLRIAALAGGCESLPDARDGEWQSGDALMAWRWLSMATEAEASRWAKACPREWAWFLLGFPGLCQDAGTGIDPGLIFSPPLLPLVESMMPWSEMMWTRALSSWVSCGKPARKAVTGAWRSWSGLCAGSGRPDLARGMIRGTAAACSRRDWLERLRDYLPSSGTAGITGAASFSEVESLESDWLSVADMLADMVSFRDQAEEPVYIDETYASACALKESVPPSMRDRLACSAREVRAMAVLGRGGSG